MLTQEQVERCKQGCPEGTDLRTCQVFLNGECPIIKRYKDGNLVFAQNKQTELFPQPM